LRKDSRVRVRRRLLRMAPKLQDGNPLGLRRSVVTSRPSLLLRLHAPGKQYDQCKTKTAMNHDATPFNPEATPTACGPRRSTASFNPEPTATACGPRRRRCLRVKLMGARSAGFPGIPNRRAVG